MAHVIDNTPTDPNVRPAERAARRPLRPEFATAPFLVIWETTQACDLACLHCRASARTYRDPRELSTVEAKRLMDTVADMGQPLFVLTGGDPLKRPDTVELVAYGTRIGLRVAMTPSGTPLMTPDVLAKLRDAGLARLAVSLDGATAAVHDRFRGVAGSFDWSVRMLHAARDLGLSTQVNTTISRHNIADVDALMEFMPTLGLALWAVFAVVPTGRASAGQLPTADDMERVFERLYAFSEIAPFDVKTTAAPHYRRVALQQHQARRRGDREAARSTGLPDPVDAALSAGLARSRGVNDGNGFVFVNHVGEIYPCGFLPVSAGNVRTHRLADVYQHDPMFLALRDADRLKGKCGVCEFRRVCGGSRARAYAMTGDWLESDPLCAYVPPTFDRSA